MDLLEGKVQKASRADEGRLKSITVSSAKTKMTLRGQTKTFCKRQGEGSGVKKKNVFMGCELLAMTKAVFGGKFR